MSGGHRKGHGNDVSDRKSAAAINLLAKEPVVDAGKGSRSFPSQFVREFVGLNDNFSRLRHLMAQGDNPRT